MMTHPAGAAGGGAEFEGGGCGRDGNDVCACSGGASDCVNKLVKGAVRQSWPCSTAKEDAGDRATMGIDPAQPDPVRPHLPQICVVCASRKACIVWSRRSSARETGRSQLLPAQASA